VVERPVSVVKEAVENALDAGARDIRVSLFEGGKVRIVVEDDGEGMAFDDLPLAVARHGTSKISSVEELETIRSLGFRGEALASIAAVSKLEIRSRREGDELGGLIRVEGGRVVLHVPAPCAKGTSLSVEDLFCTLPARKKFLKSAASEWRRVSSLVRDMAVAYPSLRFSEFHDGRAGFSSTGDGDREGVLRSLWGDGGDLRHGTVRTANLQLECWCMPFPGRARSDVTAFVNGRALSDPVIRGAAGSLCRSLPGNWVLLFSCAPDVVDVNIHPAKAEVRFRYPGEVFDAVQQAVLCLSGEAPAMPAIPPIPGGSSPAPSAGWSFHERGKPVEGPLFGRVAAPSGFIQDREESAPEEAVPAFEPEGVRFLGQIASGYLVFETEEGVVVMDPHAAHERIGYERMQRLSMASRTVQRCAVPLPLPPSLAASAREHRDGLETAGFRFSDQDGVFAVDAFPTLLGDAGEDPVRLLRGVLLEWNEDRKGTLEDTLWRRLATIACGLSVKLGAAMSPSECLSLWRDLTSCSAPWSCPHGRPTVLVLSKEKLESFFGRE
jgi:DNA mismatch repair protein MutL